MPIPNFVPSYSLGLPGAIRESLNAMRLWRSCRGRRWRWAADDGQERRPAAGDASRARRVLAQVNNLVRRADSDACDPAGARQRWAGPAAWAAARGRFRQPDRADRAARSRRKAGRTVGGPGSISGFENNLSLVVSQTQEVHEQIADLLEQLRRLQDLQVTIEVRFITLADNFFERIGVDFDLSIDDNTGLNDRIPLLAIGVARRRRRTANSRFYDDSHKSISIGWTATGADGRLGHQAHAGQLRLRATPQFGGL